MKLAIIRVRGHGRKSHIVETTFNQLGLKQKNHCAIVEDDAHIQGMLHVIEPFATWGPISEETLKATKSKENVLRLSSPRKGYGRKGVKLPFSQKGAYGNRGDKINDLIMRMI